jgi:signal transduction histidine kinase
VSLARAAALDVQIFLADSQAEAQMLALDPLVRQPASASELERLLERVRQALPTWQSVGVFGADGWNLALTDSPPRSIDHSARPYFQRVLATGTAAVGPAAMPSENGSPAPVAVVGVPVQFANGESGVLTVAPSAARLSEQLSAQGAPPGVRIFVLDARGNVFVSTDPSLPGLESRRGRPEVEAVLAGQTGGQRVRDTDGTEWVVAYAPVDDTGWGVVVTQEAATALGPVDRQVFAALAVLAATVVFATTLGWILGGRLSAFYDRAVEATRLRDAVLASVSHDLRNPLQGIKAEAQLLKRRVTRGGGASTEQIDDALTCIDQAAVRMSSMIDELLDTARLQAGQRLALRREPVDLVPLVREVIAEQSAVERERSIRFSAPPAGVVAEIDPARVRRVIENLLSNALKYSGQDSDVSVQLAAEASWAVVRIQDQGLGIPAADLPHVFEYFHRAGNVATRLPGIGLGLPGSQRIVEQHGGSIAVDSREGAGSTFTVRLPLAPTATPVSPDQYPATETAGIS